MLPKKFNRFRIHRMNPDMARIITVKVNDTLISRLSISKKLLQSMNCAKKTHCLIGIDNKSKKIAFKFIDKKDPEFKSEMGVKKLEYNTGNIRISLSGLGVKFKKGDVKLDIKKNHVEFAAGKFIIVKNTYVKKTKTLRRRSPVLATA